MSISRKARFAWKNKKLRIGRRRETRIRIETLYTSLKESFLLGTAYAPSKEDVYFERIYGYASREKIEVFRAIFGNHRFDINEVMSFLNGRERFLQPPPIDITDSFVYIEKITCVHLTDFEIRGDSIFCRAYYWTPWGNIPVVVEGFSGLRIRLAVFVGPYKNECLGVGNFTLVRLPDNEWIDEQKEKTEQAIADLKTNWPYKNDGSSDLDGIKIPDFKNQYVGIVASDPPSGYSEKPTL